MKTFTLAAIALAGLSSAALAAPTHSVKAAPAAKAAVLVCPVSGDKIASAAQAYSHETYKGKTYYFCCPACKPTFDKNPDKVIADAAKGKYGKM